jgi:hypothetical protein
MTTKQLKSALRKHPFILARHESGLQIGINSKVLNMAAKRHNNDNEETWYQSFNPCSFMEYISHKTPFVTT